VVCGGRLEDLGEGWWAEREQEKERENKMEQKWKKGGEK